MGNQKGLGRGNGSGMEDGVGPSPGRMKDPVMREKNGHQMLNLGGGGRENGG